MRIKSRIRTIPHYSQTGVYFRDIMTLLKNAAGFHLTIEKHAERYHSVPIDLVVGIEARGFILGAALAFALDKGFVPIRKKGKLPTATRPVDYALENCVGSVEIHEDTIETGQQVLLVDELIAMGCTMLAAVDLACQAS